MTEKIAETNEKYREALIEKIRFYQDYIEMVKLVCERQSRYIKNDIETCHLINEIKLVNLELE